MYLLGNFKHQAEIGSHTFLMRQYQINSYQFPFWQLLKAFWGQKTDQKVSWQKAFPDSMLNWWSPAPEGEILAPVSLVNQHQPKCKWRKYWLPLTGSTVSVGKLRARLWSEHFLYRIDWKYISDRDIWLCKWVQTICQAICHLEQLHFRNAGRRHHRFILDICATVAWGLWWCCSVPLHVPPCAPGWDTRNCQGGQDFWI